jgi:hypothetical protein
MRFTRRPFLSSIVGARTVIGPVVLGWSIALAGCGSPGPSATAPALTALPALPSASTATTGGTPGIPSPSGISAPSASPAASASASPSASPSPSPDELDTAEGIDGRVPTLLASRVELYAGAVSVTPGEPITLHVSTLARQYGYRVERLDATRPAGVEVVTQASGRPGHDYRSRATIDSLTRVARANWPATDTVATTGWAPGVYLVTATDSRGTTGQAIFVVRTPVMRADRPAFVFSALTYQAYNLWGGANLYAYAAPRAVRVSFERPYALEDGKGYWALGDGRILAWLQRRGLDLQYTTDYDLSVAPPPVAPRLLIFGRHTEYVAAGLFDFVDQHVNVTGDMNVLNFGANGFYWQVRLVAPRTPGAPMDVVCYRRPADDPVGKARPSEMTTRWRNAPLNRPEGMLFGAQYVNVLGNGFARYDYTVGAAMPAELLAGTGWQAGTVIRGLLLGEGDLAYRGSGGISIMDGHGVDPKGMPLATSVTIRVSPAGARVFDAGTFAWADGFEPAKVRLGITAGSFERFNRNLLAWLGVPAAS